MKKAGEAIREVRGERHGCHAAAAGRANRVLDDAGKATQQAWSKAGGMAEGAAADGASTSASRQIADNPFIAVGVRDRLRRGLVDSRTTVDREEPKTTRRILKTRRSGWT